MPEGHSVHRIARQFRVNFCGVAVEASSPQGRFAEGAARLSGHKMTDVFAVGKHLFVEFDHGDWLRVHLGIYGAWDFSGDIMGEKSVGSLGAPRLSRMRMSEESRVRASDDNFPSAPVGAVRLRLLTPSVCADLRGPTACEILTDVQVSAVIARLGPDPQHDSTDAARDKFVNSVRKRGVPIGQLLMDQSVVAGIGNVYRAEMLFRASIDPYRPGNQVSVDEARQLWSDWVVLLALGIETGQMMTMDGLTATAWKAALARRIDRHWVYKREGLPCRLCGTHIALAEMANRKLYWCPACQT